MAAGDKIAAHQNKIFQIVASGALTDLLAKMNGMPDSYQNTQSQDEFVNYLRITLAQPGSLNIVFFHQVYVDVINKIEGYNYSSASIGESYEAPSNISVNGSTISCDNPETGAILLYEWDFVDFIESAIVGTVNADRLEFTSVPAGNYILAYDSADRLPSSYITVS